MVTGSFPLDLHAPFSGGTAFWLAEAEEECMHHSVAMHGKLAWETNFAMVANVNGDKTQCCHQLAWETNLGQVLMSLIESLVDTMIKEE